VLAMRQLVHDTEHDPAALDAIGWPLRWHAPPGEADSWKLDKKIAGKIVRQQYDVDAKGDSTAWLRYEHVVPTYEVWQHIASLEETKNPQQNDASFAHVDRRKLRRLVTDANPYDGRVERARMYPDSLRTDPTKDGLNWVSDLMVEADVKA